MGEPIRRTPAGKGQIVSLHYMRGLAALLVVFAHIFVVGGTNSTIPRLYLPMIAAPFITASATHQAMIYNHIDAAMRDYGLGAGELGVLVFFLISGFVIQKSLRATPPGRFLARRAFRIYPVVFGVLMPTAAILAYAGQHAGVSTLYTFKDVLASSLLASGWLQLPYTNPLIWTLMVEVTFYAVMAAMVGLCGQIRYREIILLGVVCLITVLFGNNTPLIVAEIIDYFHYNPLLYAAYNANFILMILIGAAIHEGYNTPGTGWRCAAAVLVLLGCYDISVNIFNQYHPGLLGMSFGPALSALALFLGGLAIERKLPRIPILNFLGNVSYPLYLVHIPLGWALIYAFTRIGLNIHLSLFASAAGCIAASWAVHVAIEEPANRWGKKLTDGVGRRRSRDTRPAEPLIDLRVPDSLV